MKNYFRGWVDVQNQGVSNDYAYYVCLTDDIPHVWLTVALAGSTEQRTRMGMYEEKYGVVTSMFEYSIKTFCSIFVVLMISETMPTNPQNSSAATNKTDRNHNGSSEVVGHLPENLSNSHSHNAWRLAKNASRRRQLTGVKRKSNDRLWGGNSNLFFHYIPLFRFQRAV